MDKHSPCTPREASIAALVRTLQQFGVPQALVVARVRRRYLLSAHEAARTVQAHWNTAQSHKEE